MAIKISIIITLATIMATANPITTKPSNALKNSCLNCHTQQKIPSDLIYRRYLMRYSTNKQMQKTILEYLKNPNPKKSIMPKQFFLKFPQKESFEGNSSNLERGVKAYLEYFDVKSRLKLSKPR